MPTAQILKHIQEKIIDTGRDTRYSLDAYIFVMTGLDYYRVKVGERRHFSGQELSTGLAEFACKQFGPMAWPVLNKMGIYKTDDFGYIVYNCIEIGLIQKQEGDCVEDFFNACDLCQFVSENPLPALEKDFISTVRGA